MICNAYMSFFVVLLESYQHPKYTPHQHSKLAPAGKTYLMLVHQAHLLPMPGTSKPSNQHPMLETSKPATSTSCWSQDIQLICAFFPLYMLQLTNIHILVVHKTTNSLKCFSALQIRTCFKSKNHV